MKNLLDFFVKHSSWFVLILYVILSCVLLFNNNPYQQSVYLTSANAVCATVYEGMSSITDYFHLKGINEDLQERNALLEMQVVDLRAQVNDLKMQLPDTLKSQPVLQHFDFVVAHVISNSIAQTNNYITINRGAADGIKPEQGVVDQAGVVGVVNVVGKHSARIISPCKRRRTVSSSFQAPSSRRAAATSATLPHGEPPSWRRPRQVQPNPAPIMHGNNIPNRGPFRKPRMPGRGGRAGARPSRAGMVQAKVC